FRMPVLGLNVSQPGTPEALRVGVGVPVAVKRYLYGLPTVAEVAGAPLVMVGLVGGLVHGPSVIEIESGLCMAKNAAWFPWSAYGKAYTLPPMKISLPPIVPVCRNLAYRFSFWPFGKA